jgi:hypothetical protein
MLPSWRRRRPLGQRLQPRLHLCRSAMVRWLVSWLGPNPGPTEYEVVRFCSRRRRRVQLGAEETFIDRA